MTVAPLRRGWCPSALRPMPTGDGLLVRLRLGGHSLLPALARGLAEAARRFGNGLIDLTSRGNLQLRGISEETHEPLLAHLSDLGLPDADPATDAIRNIVASPLAGLTGFGAHLDIRPIVAALEERLAKEPRLDALPAKYSFLIDDGGWPSLAEIDADLRFEARSIGGEVVFKIGRDGTARTAVDVARCAPGEVPELAVRVALQRCELPVHFDDDGGPSRDESQDVTGPPPIHKTWPRQPIGLFRGMQGQTLLGLGVSFGRLSASSLELLATAAEDLSCEALRLTPWRALLLPIGNAAKLPTWLARLAAEGFIDDPADPRVAIAACPGAPSCASATTPTQDDALRLAPVARRLAQHGIGLHVSGCAKGCACRDRVPVTLVADGGLYGLVRNGKAQDPVCGTFMPIDAMEKMLETLTATAAS
jgi:precorrin-3B synthase